MPTRAGRPKRGDVWELNIDIPGCPKNPIFFVVLELGAGDYWSLSVHVPHKGRLVWTDCAYWFSKGWLRYIGQAGPETKKRLGLT